MTREWPRVICIASGPSLSVEQTRRAAQAQADGWRVVAVNNSWVLAPGADVLYACDSKWWRASGPGYGVDARLHFGGERWSQIREEVERDEADVRELGLQYAPSVRDGLARRPGTIRRGGNSGLQAIDLSVGIFGARLVVLLGYDMQGRGHWHGDHPKELRQADDPRVWIPAFDTVARELAREGAVVLNATTETALTCFQRCELEEALCRAAA